IGELPALLEKIVPLIKSGSPVDAGIALPLFIACGRAKKRGVKAVFSGQGADELFLGYARFKSSSDLEADSAAALGKLLRSDLRWNRAIAEANGLKLETPFLGKKIMKFAGSLPNSQKISGGRNKVILRELAGALGIPPEFAERGKTAAQYGSNSDRAIERLAKKEGKTKSWYIAGLAEKKKARIAALFSGGKDSCLALWLMQRQNYGVACLVSVIPENPDSFMYHKPDLNILKMQSEALGIPLVVKKTKGDKEKELSALREALAEAKEKFGVEGVVSGALYSNYQRERIQKICNSMRLRLFSPLWHLRQEDELRELRRSGFVFVLTKIAAMGLGGKWLGKEISEDEIKQLEGISYKIGFNVAGEGGEYESLVLDAPNFKKRIVIKKSEKKMSGDFTGVFLVKSASLERKKKPRAQIN
ncbi:MAG: diphthine--ammonia ligase, partial [Candidatus Diapherotrites archaeon]|nr:diphthine--ammonia ligase [Candidatus Diapherotrites archaeon]